VSDVKRVWAEFIDTTGYELTMNLVNALFKTVGLLAEFQMMSQPLQPAFEAVVLRQTSQSATLAAFWLQLVEQFWRESTR
jgi:hypothetical protein